MQSADHLTATFAALADPTRRAILARLASGEASVTDIAKPFAMSMPAISRHLKVLEDAGLIVSGRDAQYRPRKLDAAPLREIAEWIERYRVFWEENFARMDEYIAELKQKKRGGRRGRRK
jgi:DNA-binding transcriptional ArsR family regulator